MSKSTEWEESTRKIGIARGMRYQAARSTFDGRITPKSEFYLNSCRYMDLISGASIIFTRDVGHHTSGWFKNPDYERCEHLSLSQIQDTIWMPHADPGELDRKTERAWVEAFFAPEARKLLWAEGAVSPDGKRLGVLHWRLFCNEQWAPILPRKEVYTREFTEKGFKSFSEILGEQTFRVEGLPEEP